MDLWMIVVHIDGLCGPVNPGGKATCGCVIRDDSGSILTGKSGVVGKGPAMSNSVAEYAALCEALEFLLKKNRGKFFYRSERRFRSRYESDERQVEIPERPVPREVSRSGAFARPVR